MNALKVGIIGAGGIARDAHLPHLARKRDAGEIEISGISDVNGEAAKATANEFGALRSETDWRELLPHCDAILICVPTHLHAEIAGAALREGKAVFCEKPLARTLEQADAMLEAQRAGGGVLQVGFVRRFDAEWLTWRDAVLQDKIGRPISWRSLMASPGPSPSLWFYQEATGGGPFLDGVIHNLDFALHTFGAASRVFCHARTMRSDGDALDTGTATIEFQSGDELLLAWSWGLPQNTSGAGAFDLIGPKGTLTWPPREEGESPYFLLQQTEGNSKIPFPEGAITTAFNDQMDEFVLAAKGGVLPRADGVQARESLRLALAILESGRGKKVVELG